MIRTVGHSLCGSRLKTTSLLLPTDMQAVDWSSLDPAMGGSYYYPGENFDVWRAQFKALCERQQWSDSVAKPFAFVYMGELAAEAVMNIPYDGPESLNQFLDAYRHRLQTIRKPEDTTSTRRGVIPGAPSPEFNRNETKEPPPAADTWPSGTPTITVSRRTPRSYCANRNPRRTIRRNRPASQR